MSRIGFIGLGNMGLPMARNIAAEKQHSIYVYDVNEEMLSDILWPDNVVPTSDILQLARHSEIIITCLPNISIVQQVYLGNNSILPELKQGALAIDMSSSDPNLTVELGAALHQNGVNLIDAPVSGGVKKALSGELAILVGSDEADFKKVSLNYF